MSMRNVLCLLFALSAGGLPAEEQNKFLSYYDTETVRLNYDWFSGLTVSYRGTSYGTFFGLDPVVKKTLVSDPDAQRYIDTYSSLNLAGNVLYWGGFAVAVVGEAVVLPSLLRPYGATGENVTISLITGVGGLAAALIGAFLIPAALDSLVKGVNTYNRNKIKAYPQ